MLEGGASERSFTVDSPSGPNRNLSMFVPKYWSRTQSDIGADKGRESIGPIIDRTTCEEVVGTPYLSDNERGFYLENCRPKTFQASGGAGNTGGSDNRPQEPREEPLVRIEPIDASTSYGGATHYGISYEGHSLGCPAITLPAGRRDNLYHSSDRQIAAVPPSRYSTWPCGTPLQVCGAAGCIRVIRMDACPGCDAAGVIIDLSEAGIEAVCGQLGRCQVSVELSN